MNWRQAGMMVEITKDFNPNPTYYGKLLRSNNFRWLSLKIHDGTNIVRNLDKDWIAAIKAQKIAVGGWGVQQREPVAEAELAHQLITEFKLQHYFADAEAPHKSDTGGDPNRSRLFVQRFKELRPSRHFPKCLTTYGAAAGDNILGSIRDANQVMDFNVWYKNSWRFAPQVYPCEFGEVYSLENCIKHAQRAGWPLSLVKPMLGNYNDWHAVDYREDLKSSYKKHTPLKGLSIFIASTCREEDIEDYGRYIKNWWLADT